MKSSIVSPRGLASAALFLAVAYGAAHALGLRADATILSGTAPPDPGGTTLGLVYVVLYFGFVVLAPILAIAAALMALLGRFTARH